MSDHTSHLNATGQCLIIPQTFIQFQVCVCVPTRMWGTRAKVYLSAYMKSLVLTFKDLRFLGSSLKSERPLICRANQRVMGQKGKSPAFCLESQGVVCYWLDFQGPPTVCVHSSLSFAWPPLSLLGHALSGQDLFSVKNHTEFYSVWSSVYI